MKELQTLSCVASIFTSLSLLSPLVSWLRPTTLSYTSSLHTPSHEYIQCVFIQRMRPSARRSGFAGATVSSAETTKTGFLRENYPYPRILRSYSYGWFFYFRTVAILSLEGYFLDSPWWVVHRHAARADSCRQDHGMNLPNLLLWVERRGGCMKRVWSDGERQCADVSRSLCAMCFTSIPHNRGNLMGRSPSMRQAGPWNESSEPSRMSVERCGGPPPAVHQSGASIGEPSNEKIFYKPDCFMCY